MRYFSFQGWTKYFFTFVPFSFRETAAAECQYFSLCFFLRKNRQRLCKLPSCSSLNRSGNRFNAILVFVRKRERVFAFLLVLRIQTYLPIQQTKYQMTKLSPCVNHVKYCPSFIWSWVPISLRALNSL